MQIEPRDGEEVCVRGLWSEVFVCVCVYLCMLVCNCVRLTKRMRMHRPIIQLALGPWNCDVL
jgi:hypothetical protein